MQTVEPGYREPGLKAVRDAWAVHHRLLVAVETRREPTPPLYLPGLDDDQPTVRRIVRHDYLTKKGLVKAVGGFTTYPAYLLDRLSTEATVEILNCRATAKARKNVVDDDDLAQMNLASNSYGAFRNSRRGCLIAVDNIQYHRMQ